MNSIRRVALLIETSRTYSRLLLRGVKRYMSERGPWSVFLEMRALDSRIPPWLSHWHGDGILSRSATQEMVDAVQKAGVPGVELRASKLKHSLPFVGVDNAALGRMVAEHLLERGFRQFGCYEIDSESFFEERRDNFIAVVRERGFACNIYHQKQGSERPAQWERQQAELIDWLKELPKPCGVMACTDQLGFWLLDACHRAGIAVPEEVAVVGVEDDESLCEMATPPMSSVHFPGARIGYEAAALLDRLMSGEPAPQQALLFAPIGIVTRGSSDIVAIEDPVVSRALRFIREHSRDGIQVDDVAAAAGVSRSTLERRMQRLLGRSPQNEIVRVKLNLVKQLLAETDLPLEEVAHRAGFAHAQYLSELFRKSFGTTPGQFRRNMRVPEGPRVADRRR